MTTPHPAGPTGPHPVAPVSLVRLGGRRDQPLLVLGPALGTSAQALWSAAARLLAADFQVVAWDLPGHGTNPWVPEPAADDGEGAPGVLDVAGLARGVLAAVDALEGGGFEPPRFHYAGVSGGGAVGLQLLLDAPHRVASATVLGTAARLGDPATWRARAATAVRDGTAALAAASAKRWFAPGFADREPTRAAAVLQALGRADAMAYAAVCGALADLDLRGRLDDVAAPVLAVAGAEDVATPPALLEELAAGVQDGRLVVLDGVAHLAPLEAPEQVARLVRAHALGEPDDVGREAAALAAAHAAGAAWDRPGLDRRTRAAVVLAALVASGDHDDLAEQVRLARRHGLGVDEVREVLLHAAVAAGAGAARAASTARAALQAAEEG